MKNKLLTNSHIKWFFRASLPFSRTSRSIFRASSPKGSEAKDLRVSFFISWATLDWSLIKYLFFFFWVCLQKAFLVASCWWNGGNLYLFWWLLRNNYCISGLLWRKCIIQGFVSCCSQALRCNSFVFSSSPTVQYCCFLYQAFLISWLSFS